MLENKLTLVVDYLISGDLCYLSHLETMSMFQKALVRSGIDIVFSRGFNPHPRMSVPLPRGVGVRSYGDKLVVRIHGGSDIRAAELEKNLNQQLPSQCRLLSSELYDRKISCRPKSALYSFVFKNAHNAYQKSVCLQEKFISQDPMVVERQVNGKIKKRDIKGFIDSVNYEDSRIGIRANISNKGTVRPDEILILTGSEERDLSEPVTRRDIVWEIK